ncbi:MAG TPA: IS1595 family transposase [Terracidiphilus sp.]|nr:IS1595 family transposase [Terracidiphilus sp.]
MTDRTNLCIIALMDHFSIPKTLLEAVKFYSDPANCREHMIAVRWLDGIVRCPTCGSEKVTFLKAANLYKCYGRHDRAKFSLKVGTVFEDSPIGLDKWLPVVWMLANCKNGISSYEIHRAIGVTQKTAWFMLHRIRKAMAARSFVKLGGSDGGPVEVDECFVGPKPQKMHRERRLKMQTALKGCGDGRKTIVMGMLDRDSRKVRAHVVPNVKRETLQGAILAEIEQGSSVYTDGCSSYDHLAARNYIHETVNHVEEYVRGEVHTNGIENFWSLLRRGLTGTYVAVEPFHLDSYVVEQVFRYNNRATKDNPLQDSDRFMLALSQIAGKRLTYAELTGKVGETRF